MTNVAVIGTGYVGLVTGVVLSEIGHTVICVDINEGKISKLSQGISPIYEPGLDALMKKNMEANRLFFTTDHKEAFKDAEMVIIAVGTPQSESGAADLNYVKQAAKDIAENIVNDTIVIIKSTVPVGTNDLVESIIKEYLVADVQVDVVSCPEFLREGHAIHDTFHGDRIVIGAEKEDIGDKVEALFKPLNIPVVRTNRRSAEMIKYAANAFLAVKISYINQIANLCEKLGADVKSVAEGIGMDHRIGRMFLNAGLGYGGSCFPKDTEALVYLAKEAKTNLSIVEAAIKANEEQSKIFIKKVLNAFNGNLNDKTIAILGLTFKPNTDDLREAPSIKIIKQLLSYGSKVKVYDPIIKYLHEFRDEIEYASTLNDCLKDVDAALLVTEWDSFKDADWAKLVNFPKNPLLFDGRNILPTKKLISYGWKIEGIGQPSLMENKEIKVY